MVKLKYAAQTAEQWYGEELRLYAQIYQQLHFHNEVKDYFFQHNILNELRHSAAERRFNRIARRAKLLGEEGLSLLNKASIQDADALILMSYLKAYRFPYEFVFEHLISKFYDSNQTIFVAEIDYFYEHKHTQFPDELNWSYQSQKRIRSQLIKILLCSQLIKKINTGDYELQKLLVSEDVYHFFLKHPPFDMIVL